MLNLNEEWKKAYDEFLLDEEASINNDIENLFVELSEAQDRTEHAYQILAEYYTILAEWPGNDAQPGSQESGNMRNSRDNNNEPRKSRDEERASENASGTFRNILDLFAKDDDLNYDKKEDYMSVTQYKTERLSDMKFPKNIIFFITQIIKWIKNVVMYFIDKFLNIIRKLTGHKEKVLDPKVLRLSFEKAKEVESVTKEISTGAKGVDKVVKLLALRPDAAQANTTLPTTTIRGEIRPDAAGNIVTEGILDYYDEKKEERIDKVNVVVSVDISKDLMHLKEYIQHFYELYDNAYGSNNEKLFDTEDLEVILTSLKNTVENINFGTTAVFKADGIAFEAPEVSTTKVRNTLVTTNANIAALKSAYVQTSESVSKISQIINSKEMLMVANRAATYTLLSSSTYKQMIEIMNSILIRLKESTEMEKKLQKVQKDYNDLCNSLNSVQTTLMSVGKVSFDTPYNKKMVEVVAAAKMMSQVVTLRLTALGLYIKQLKDIRDQIVMLANINSGDLKAIERMKKNSLNAKLYSKKFR